MIRITHRDIAAQLGLSQSTVSRALHDHPSIPAKTRKRVKSFAQEMGYRPNIPMSEMISARWQKAHVAKGNVIGYIDTVGREDATYVGGVDLNDALTEHASLLGYELAIFRRAHFSSSAKLQRVLRSRGITDVILGTIFEQSLMVDFDWSKFICVQVSPGLFRLPLHSVTKDHFNSVLLAWQQAASRGYQRIGVILLQHRVKLMDDVLRSSAVHACQRDLFAHLPRLEPYYFGVKGEGAEDFYDWVKANRPDVIIGFSSAHYAYYKARFQKEIAYITLHLGSDDTILSGISESNSQCAREAINLLHFCRRTHQWGIPLQRIDHVVEPIWVEGKTLPQVTAPST